VRTETSPPWCGLRAARLAALALALLAPAPLPAQEPSSADLIRRRDELLEMHRRDPVARSALAQEISKIETVLGHRALNEQRPEEAIDRYRSALLHFEGQEHARAGLVAALLKTEQVDYALSEALAGVAGHPGSADLHALHGEVLYRLNRLDEATAAWRRSLEIRPDPELRERLARTDLEQQKTGAFRTSEAPHFTLQYDGEKLTPAVEDGIITVLEEGFDEYVRVLDHLPDATITVILYTRQAFRDITEAPSLVEGLFDGKVRLPMGGLSHLTPGARATIRHELAHAFIHSKTRGAAPRWLHEGIAQWLEPRSAGAYGAALAREASRRAPGTAVPFSYPAALSQVEYLVQTYGAHDVVELLTHLREGKNLDIALRETFRVDIPGLQAEWSQWLARTHGGS